MYVDPEPPNRQSRPIFLRLKTVTKRQQCVRIPVILAQKIRRIAANPSEASGNAPMLPQALGIDRSQPAPLAVLTDCRVRRHAARRIDGVLGMRQHRARESKLG